MTKLTTVQNELTNIKMYWLAVSFKVTNPNISMALVRPHAPDIGSSTIEIPKWSIPEVLMLLYKAVDLVNTIIYTTTVYNKIKLKQIGKQQVMPYVLVLWKKKYFWKLQNIRKLCVSFSLANIFAAISLRFFKQDIYKFFIEKKWSIK